MLNKKLTINTMNGNCRYTALLARVLLSALFIYGGIMKIIGFEAVVGFVTGTLPAPQLMIVLAIIAELGGGLAILFGFKARSVAFLLTVFLVIVTAIFHLDFSEQAKVGQFLSNLGLMGGLLMITAAGAGKYSVDGE